MTVPLAVTMELVSQVAASSLIYWRAQHPQSREKVKIPLRINWM
jgi:hypothetical protein